MGSGLKTLRFFSYLSSEAQRHVVEAFLRKRKSARLVAEVVENSVKRGHEHERLATAAAPCRLHGATLLIARADPRALTLLRALRALDLDSQGVDFVCIDKKVTARSLPRLIAK